MNFWAILGIVNAAVIALSLFLFRGSHTGSSSEDALSDTLAGFIFCAIIVVLLVSDLIAAILHWL